MRVLLKLFLVGVFATILTGCADTWMGEDLSKDQGNLSYSQAVKKWGPPDSKEKLNNGTVVAKWTRDYSYMLDREEPTLLSSGSYTYTPYYWDSMEQRVVTESLVATFNKRGILIDWYLR